MVRKLVFLSGLAIAVCTALLLVLAIYGNTEREDSLAIGERVVSNLHLGMQRTETQQYVQAAWRQYRCDYGDWAEDVYLFGSRDTNLAAIVILRFSKQGEQEILDQISSYDSYMLYKFADCQVSEK